jgi:Fur family zinc uptake transcriptional regulator
LASGNARNHSNSGLNLRKMKTADSIERTLDHAESLCRKRGEQLTPTRRRVLGLLLKADGPIKAYDLLEQIRPDGKAKPPTVYRALDFLMASGLVHKVEALNAFIPCVEHDHLGHGCSAELYICGDCGSVEERHGTPRPDDAPSGFKIDRSVVEYYGLCERCIH